MAAKTNTGGSKLNKKTSTKRPGVHGKKKTSKIKNSKLYKKKNVGQGK